MNIIFKFISFPLTFAVGFISLILLAFINADMVGKLNRNELKMVDARKQMISDFDNFFLNELWTDIHPFIRALIAGGLYYYIFF